MNCQAKVSRRRWAGVSARIITEIEGWTVASAAP